METTGITVTGQGSVRRPPDLARVTLGVRVTEPSVADAVAAAATVAAAVGAAMRARGVADDDIGTAMFSIQPEHHYPHDGEPVLRGYTVNHTLTVTVRDISAVGATIDAAATAAGDRCIVEGVQFDIGDAGDDLAVARGLAWEHAAAKADQLASLAGVTLGAAVEITEHGTAAGPQPKLRSAAMAFADAGTGIEPGSSSATVTLTVRFALAD